MISVFILTKDRLSDLKRSLRSLAIQTVPPDEILIINNGKPLPGTIFASLGKFRKKLRVLADGGTRLSHLFNRGWQESRGEVIAYIADDAEADPEWLENIQRTLRDFPKAAAASGPVLSTCWPTGEMHRIYLASQHPILRYILRPYFRLVYEDRILDPGILLGSGAYTIGAALPESRRFSVPFAIDLLTTTSMGIRRAALEHIGGFDEQFHFNHADGDVFVRLKRASYHLIFDPTIIVHHHVRLGPSRNPYFVGKDTARFFLKDIRPKHVRAWIGAILHLATLFGYFLIMAIARANPKYLGGIWGLFRGVVAYPLERERLAPKTYPRIRQSRESVCAEVNQKVGRGR